MLILIFSFSACNSLNEKEDIELVKDRYIDKVVENNEDNVNNNVNNQLVKDFIVKFISSIKNEDSESFKNLVSQDGIYSISYFVDGRDKNVVLHLNKDEIRGDLVLANLEKIGITLATMFSEEIVSSIENMPINSSTILSDISFYVDWHFDDENRIESKLEEIVNTCEKIILTNNQDIPQVFLLKDNIFAFTQSTATHEPDVECTGDWMIFEKKGEEYIILAVLQFQ
jgi:hypothetical protein